MAKIELKALSALIQKVKKSAPIVYFMNSKYLKVLALIILTVLMLTAISQNRTLTVTGNYSSNMNNQIASFSIYVSTSDKDKTKAVSETNKKADDAISQIKAFGIKDTDIKTANLNIYQREEPVWQNGVQVYKPGNWYAGLSIEIIVRDLTRVNDFTMMLTSLSSDSIYGPNFSVDNSLLDETRLLQGALDDAKEKARFISTHMNKRLGKVMTIVEGGSSSNGNYPVKVSEGMGGGGGSNLQPGTTQVSKTVTVTFELN